MIIYDLSEFSRTTFTPNGGCDDIIPRFTLLDIDKPICGLRCLGDG
jgi:hypothetical protein